MAYDIPIDDLVKTLFHNSFETGFIDLFSSVVFILGGSLKI